MFRFVLIASLFVSTSATALPRFVGDQAELFAVCSGRMSAMLTSQMGRRDPTAPETRRALDNFDLLLDAVLDAAIEEGVSEAEPRRWKARGWTEVAYLLKDAQYSFDEGVAERASRNLSKYMQDCREVLLPS